MQWSGILLPNVFYSGFCIAYDKCSEVGNSTSHEGCLRNGEGVMEKYGGVGFVSYELEGVPNGVVDAGAGGAALTGIDEAVRFFNRQQYGGPGLGAYEIPVYTGEGSWMAVIMGVMAIPATAFATSYAKKAGEKMAEKDFADIGMKDVARKSMDALVHLIEVIKHLKGLPDWTRTKIEWSNNAQRARVYNDAGAILEVPSDYIKWYKQVPKAILRRLSAPILRAGRVTFASKQDSGEFRSVDLEASQVPLLMGQEDFNEDAFLFPELRHGDDVELEGLITRGNQSTNSIGFQYQGHILNCVPETGSVRRFKAAIFLHCKLVATINRHVASLTRIDNRPTLIIRQVVQLEDDQRGQQLLFE